MNLCNAANSKTTRIAAMMYAARRISVLPLKGKVATGKWTFAQERPMVPDQAAGIWSRHPEYNVGIVCGKVSGLVVLDFDGLKAFDLFAGSFPELLDTFTVLTGSGNGKHVYLQPRTIPDNVRVMGLPVGNLELRSNGSYVVAPPSIHPDTGQPYRVDNPVPVMPVRDLNSVVEWLKGLRQPAMPAPARRPEKTTGQGVPLGKVRYPRAYALTALRKECETLQHTPQGNRNHQLNTAAYNLGQLIGLGWLNSMEVTRALLDVAIHSGLNERESLATINSGLTTGMADNRVQQWQRR